jgi:hypothetical protein
MCCAAEIGMMIFGIITLARGKFSLTKNLVVTGTPAYVIGIILTVTLPLNMGIGFLIGVIFAIQAHGQPVNAQQLQTPAMIAEVATTGIALLLVVVIAAAASRRSKGSEGQGGPDRIDR